MKNDYKHRCYISGKITGLNIDIARIRFKEAAFFVIVNLHLFPINPMSQRFSTEKKSWVGYMWHCILLLLKCKSIYMQSNWKDSRGAKIELWIAKILRKNIYYSK